MKQVVVSSRRSPRGRGRQKFAYLKEEDHVKSAIGRRLAATKSEAAARREVLAIAGAKKVTEKKQPKNGWDGGAERPGFRVYDRYLKEIKDWKVGQEVVLVMRAKVVQAEATDEGKNKQTSARLEITDIGTL